MNEDVYSIAYLYQMKRAWTEDLPSEDELEKSREDQAYRSRTEKRMKTLKIDE